MTTAFQRFAPRSLAVAAEADQPRPSTSTKALPVQPWHLPEVGVARAAVGAVEHHGEPPAEPSESLVGVRDRARQEGFAQGQAEARAILAEQSQQLQLALAALREARSCLDDELQQEILLLAKALAQALVAREIDADPSLLAEAVKSAVALLPSTEGPLQLHLHPSDAKLMRRQAAEAEPLGNCWQIVEEPGLARGGCVLKQGSSTLDQSVASRLDSLLSQLLNEEHGSDVFLDDA